MTDITVPAGFRRNNQGHLVPENQIRPIDQARDELVQGIVVGAKALRKLLVKFRRQTFDDVQAFVQLSAEQYEVKLGGSKGNLTLMSFDGEYKVIRAISETINFDERLQAAKELIDECLREWTEDAKPEVAVLVQDAFRVNTSGEIRTGSVLGLRRLNIQDARWQRAMRAIGEAVQVVGSKTYLRIYQRDERGAYQPISLDIAAVDHE
ncbi:MAG: DUF3164 family protein [Stenotrophomonas sp.]|uniref:DUF3164 family protein n=1 Tax=Stenotrophomonas sp. TaxID=69392 RepID=UPI003D6D4146